MRIAMNDYNIIEENGEFIGVFLGFDFVAEHEFGIKGLNKLLSIEQVDIDNQKRKIKKHQLGVNARRVRSTNFTKLDNFTFKGNEYSFLATTYVAKKENIADYISNSFGVYMETMIERNGLATAWSDSEFCIVMPKENHNILEDLYENMKNKNVILSTFHGESPFSNPSLGLLKIDKLPEKVKDDMLKRDIDSIHLSIADDKTGIKDKLKAKQKEWEEAYPFSNSTPWDYIALLPRFSKGNIIYWLNPSNQDLVSSGWYKVKDLEKWIEQKPCKIVPEKNWDKLLWQCKSNKFRFLKYSYHDFIDVKPEYHRSDNFKKLIKSTPKDRENDFNIIASHILYLLYKDMRDQVEISGKNNIHEVEVRRPEDERIFGFTEALTFFGLGYFGAVNTPKNIENFSWLTDTLREQAWFILAKEKGVITDEEEELYLKGKKK